MGPSWIALQRHPRDGELAGRRGGRPASSRRAERTPTAWRALPPRPRARRRRPRDPGRCSCRPPRRVRIHPAERRSVLAEDLGDAVVGDQEYVPGVTRILERRPPTGGWAGAQECVEILAGQPASERGAVAAGEPAHGLGHRRPARSRRTRSRTPGRSSPAPGAPRRLRWSWPYRPRGCGADRPRAPRTRPHWRRSPCGCASPWSRSRCAGAARRAVRRAGADGPRARARTRRSRPRRSCRPRARPRAPLRRRPARARCSPAPRSAA